LARLTVKELSLQLQTQINKNQALEAQIAEMREELAKAQAKTEAPPKPTVPNRVIMTPQEVLSNLGVYDKMPETHQAILEHMEVFKTAKGFMMYVPKEDYLKLDSEAKKLVIETYTRLAKWLSASGKGRQIGKWFATVDGQSYTGLHAEVNN
jgi:NAD(P)H-dependent flavin oxidoreductase YrpB (nitropropane dioxygenase family)